MSHNAYTRSGGIWYNGIDHLNASDLLDFEQKMYKAVNGDDGGTWTPSSQIVIAGAGLSATPLTVQILNLTNGSSSLSNIAALQQATGMTDEQVVFVRGYGWYVFRTPNFTAQSLPWVVQPTLAGSAASITQTGSTSAVTGLSNITASIVGGTITISGSSSGNNNTFTIVTATPPGTVTYSNSSGVTDLSGAISWSASASGKWFNQLAALEGSANGLCPLDGTSQVPMANLHTNGVAGTLPTIDGSGKLVASYGGNASTLATLDANTRLVQSAQFVYGVASTTAMTAISGPTDQLVVVAGQSVYRFTLGSTQSVSHPTVYADNGNTGRWFLLAPGQDLADVASGVAYLDSSVKVPMSNLYGNVANGVAVLDSGALVPNASLHLNSAGGPPALNGSSLLSSSFGGAASTLATLDSNGWVPVSELGNIQYIIGSGAGHATANTQLSGFGPFIANGANTLGLTSSALTVPIVTLGGLLLFRALVSINFIAGGDTANGSIYVEDLATTIITPLYPWNAASASNGLLTVPVFATINGSGFSHSLQIILTASGLSDGNAQARVDHYDYITIA